MTKNLFKPFLWGILTLSTLSSCRTEDGAITQKQIEDKRFAVFVPKSGENINYARGFAFLMQRYDNLHKTNLSGINNNKPIIGNLNASASINQNASVTQGSEVYVEFGVHTKTFTEENGDKWLIYPKVQGNRVIGLIIGALTKSETYVSYHAINPQIDFYKDNIMLFQNGLDNYLKQRSRLSLSAGIKPIAEGGQKCTNDGSSFDCNIDGVVITKEPPPPLTIITEGGSDSGTGGGSGGGGGGGSNGGSGTGGQCSDYLQCMNPDSNETPPFGMVMPPPPKKPILDIKKFLSCFDQSKSANLTVYAQNMLASPPGHAFITIQQGNNIMTFGFYPRDPYLNSLSGRGIMGEDDLHPYNQALNVGTISPAQLQQIISRAIDYASARYDLAVRNCADFAREALNIANVPGANWDSNWLRPTDIANIINAQKSGVMGSGTSPVTQRTCNN